jgi:hypothetical protein
MGRPVPELEAPPLPAELAYLFDWFLDASSGRGGGFGGIQPLAWTEIEAWSRLLGLGLTPFEARVLRLLDATLVRSMSDGGHRGHHPD